MNNSDFFYFTENINHQLDFYSEIFNEPVEDLIDKFVKNNKDILNKSNKKANTKKFLDFLFKKRYPIYSKTLKKAKKIQRSFYEKKIQFHFDKTFENPDFEIKIKFKNFNELKNKLDIIKDSQPQIKKLTEILNNEDLSE
ncbi:MAG: hypothetical protein ACQESP_04685 [Candidatus Muiribacteriota bacterium]